MNGLLFSSFLFFSISLLLVLHITLYFVNYNGIVYVWCLYADMFMWKTRCKQCACYFLLLMGLPVQLFIVRSIYTYNGGHKRHWTTTTTTTTTAITTASTTYDGTHSFLNSCVNPVALYCVSGVFRQHFHRYLCCKPIQPTHHRLGLSLATNACDTSFMSTIRRPHHNHHTIVHNGSSPTQSIIMSEKRWGTILSQDTFL